MGRNPGVSREETARGHVALSVWLSPPGTACCEILGKLWKLCGPGFGETRGLDETTLKCPQDRRPGMQTGSCSFRPAETFTVSIPPLTQCWGLPTLPFLEIAKQASCISLQLALKSSGRNGQKQWPLASQPHLAGDTALP